MNKKEEKDKCSYLIETYKACLAEGLIETPDQFLLRMDASNEVATTVRPTLEQIEQEYHENK